MISIPTFDARAQYAALHDEIHAAIERVLTSGRLVLGPEVERFEADFARYLGGAGEGVGVGNGTDALTIALRALDIGPGDEVVTVANTAVATVAAIRDTGATPIFCDVDPATCLMDLADLEARLTPRTRAVVVVHLFGNAVDVSAVRACVERSSPETRIVEDCAQAHGARIAGHSVGTLGDAAAFSFYPTKNLGAYGDGGYCYSEDRDVARRMRRLRFYGFDAAAVSMEEGCNSRLDELQAAILNVKLAHLDEHLAKRRALADRYVAGLGRATPPVAVGEGVEHARHLFVVRVRERDRVRSLLAEHGVGTSVHYPTPVHRMPAYAFLGFDRGSLPVTERLADEILTLPLFPELPEHDVDRVCAALAEAAR